MRLLRNSRGDTIIEVLIAIAIASFVLGGAFVVVNRTLANSQQAQEHTEALRLAESQLEQLKSAAQATDDLCTISSVFCVPLGASRAVFCYDISGTIQPFTGATAIPPDASGYPAGCKGTDFSSAGHYRIAVLYDTKGTTSSTPSGKVDDTFTAYVNWPGATGGNDKVSLSYKVYAK